jgi:hypothetical protein
MVKSLKIIAPMVDSHPWLTTSRNKDPIFLQVSFDGFASHDGFGYPQQLESSGQNHSLAVDITMFFFVCVLYGKHRKKSGSWFSCSTNGRISGVLDIRPKIKLL